jgi:serine/threonine protein kinase
MNVNEHAQSEPGVQPKAPGDSSSAGLEDPRVIAALDEYLAALESGLKPDRQDFLARHSEIAEPLAECLEGMEALHSASSPSNLSGSERARPTLAEIGRAGMPLGDFRIVREIGRGGMGVVYEAEQLSLGRRIALKVLSFALTLDQRQLERFKNEARVAAHLHHQHIVPIYSVGCERGVHFYAMQYVEGRSLAEVIQELRRLANAPAALARPNRAEAPRETTPHETAVEPIGALSTAFSSDRPSFFRSVAQLGMQAAEALDYAHTQGVVHRDIKPANLLLDLGGHLWITDFGLAQFQSGGALTLTGDLLGTLRYMSPEQALGKRALVDHRADIYSLGATLYELLTLKTVYGGGDREELLRQITFEEPCPLRRVNAAIPADLETIVLKSLSKEIGDRYASARELAEDLRRFLQHEPIRAKRPTLLERTAKWSRRHRAVVTSAVAALVLTTAGLAVATGLTVRAYGRERQKAHEAEESFRQAREAVNQLAQIAEEELVDKPDLEGLRWRMLETTLTYYRNFIDQRRDDPSIQAELVASQDKASKILGELTILMRSLQYMPLHWEEVQNELKLSEAKRQAIQKMGEQWQRAMSESWKQPQPPDERERRRLKLAQDQEAAVAELLSAEEHQRFKQIALQFLGPLAFSDPDVAKALELSTEQKKELRGLQKHVCGPGPFGGPRGHGPKEEEAQRGLQEKIRDLLTAKQNRTWAELVGKPSSGLDEHSKRPDRDRRPDHHGPPLPPEAR